MHKRAAFILILFSIFIISPGYADECMEGDCDEGFGTGFTDDNKIYEGEWQSGMPHGRGTLYVSKEKSITGIWDKGELVKEESKAKEESVEGKGE